ncbi:MAG: hypothetical protein Q8N51_12615, partial [Gammaproteobacteria bacterium]|nr:hypothetical protein [Gammaproteobacteria bacterium]
EGPLARALAGVSVIPGVPGTVRYLADVPGVKTLGKFGKATNTGAPNPNRGVAWVSESSTAGPRAEAYQRAATGARSDVATRQPQVPALRFDNPNPRGTNAVRFDGLDPDGNVLIDRKLSITGRSKQTRDLARMNEALKQNPGQAARIEVPTEAAKRAAESRLRKLGIDIPVVVAPE